jgi:hypothetical protein
MSRSNDNSNRNRRGGPPPRRSTSHRRHHPSKNVSPTDDNTVSIVVDSDVNLLHASSHFAHAAPTDTLGEVTPLWVYKADGSVVANIYTLETEEEVGNKITRIIDVAMPVAGGRDNRATKLTSIMTLFIDKDTGECQIDEGENLPRNLPRPIGWKVVLKIDRIASQRHVHL